MSEFILNEADSSLIDHSTVSTVCHMSDAGYVALHLALDVLSVLHTHHAPWRRAGKTSC